MKELSPAARELVESHRRGKLLTDVARARMKQEVMLRASTLGGTTAVAAKAAGMSFASKVVLVALGVTGAVGAGSLSVWALRSPSPAPVTPTETAARTAGDVAAMTPAPNLNPPATVPAAAPGTLPASRPPAWVTAASARTPAPRLVTTPTVVAAPATTLAPRPAATSTVPTPLSGVASLDSSRRDHPKRTDDRPVVSAPETPNAPRVEAPDPEPELRALREARDDLRAGRPASAYRRLEEFDRHNPAGMLAPERSALSAIALCQAQPGREAQARAAQFLRRWPESPLAGRVKSACEPGHDDSR
jgi:hypothetical protein